jgi:hypothetical protein
MPASIFGPTDEVHVQQHGSRCRMWIPPEIKDPVLLHAPTRKSVGYFGAVRWRDGRFVFRLETGKFNGPSFLQFLQQLRSASCGTPETRSWSSPTTPLITPSRLPPTVAGKARSPSCSGLLSPLQSRTQSDRASVEAHALLVVCIIATSRTSKT